MSKGNDGIAFGWQDSGIQNRQRSLIRLSPWKYRPDDVLAFKDINPIAPAHILVIPKNRNGLSRLQRATMEHSEILGKLMVVAGEISRDESLGFGPEGARIVVNDGPAAGQEVPHLHIHVIGGRTMTWPPG
jgi:diadenosine tetraphosphate (Ap4A) HIT family hydrolase